ncbi:MAG TPA: MASE3 domain-containing protein [Bdellovibrionota bacterium]|jgi:signal transduction histidine kinase|nr:MASE3 domain-containing protein [Bdellovibrionota bacterium]
MQEQRKLTWALVGFFALLLILILVFPPGAELFRLGSLYLPLHILAESIGIFMAFAIFVLGWFTHRHVGSSNILFLGLASFAVACFDFGHVLSFPGMPQFVTESSANKSIYFWLAARLTDTAALLYVAISFNQSFNYYKYRVPWMIAYSLWVVVGYVVILGFPEKLPVMFSAETGLSQVKVIFEWVATAGVLTAAGFFYRNSLRPDFDEYKSMTAHLMTCGTLLFAMTGVFFTLYRLVDDLFAIAGHLYKIAAFSLMFRAVFLKCVSRPYQEAKRLAEQADMANAAKSRFLANVSHELRTPLGVISGFSELLLMRIPTGESRQWVNAIKRNADQLRMLIDDLLDLTKVENESLTIRKAPLRLDALIREVAEGMDVLAQEKALTLIVSVDPDLSAPVVSDAHRLRQILVNIVGNAVKFTSKGFVRVSARMADEDRVEISVQDTGIGIAHEKCDQLFKPFSQLDDSMTRRYGGSGLGLALSRKLAQMLGGDLWLEQSEPGKGSLFVITFTDFSAVQVSSGKLLVETHSVAPSATH